MRIKKECQVCGTPFTAIKTNQYFCKRKCFKKAYNVRKREERKTDRETNPARFGFYNCSWCSGRTVIPFSVKRYPVKWSEFVCPHCNVPRLKDAARPVDIWFWETSNYRGPYGVSSMVSSVTRVVTMALTTC